MRGLGVVVLALILVGSLALITVIWAPRGGGRVYATLATLWILALIALRSLFRLWRAILESVCVYVQARNCVSKADVGEGRHRVDTSHSTLAPVKRISMAGSERNVRQ